MTLTLTSLSKHVAILRIVFGLVWLIDASFKWMPSFRDHFVDDIMMAASGQPAWLRWVFDIGMQPFMNYPHQIAYIVACIETIIALGLLFGVGGKKLYVGGIVMAFMIWALGEGFGGPYGSNSTDIGAAVMYIFVFWALLLFDSFVPRVWSLGAYLRSRLDAPVRE